MYNFRTRLGARILLDDCLALKPGESVLVVTDHNLIELADFLAAEAESSGAETTVINMKPREAPGVEPPKPVAQAMKFSDVLLMPTSFTLAPSVARAEAQQAGARILSLGGYNRNILESKALRADFQGIMPIVMHVADKLTVF
jgi:leucyl aminopeptidase (aminopeptidase T)